MLIVRWGAGGGNLSRAAASRTSPTPSAPITPAIGGSSLKLNSSSNISTERL